MTKIWFERKFAFENMEGTFPGILERITGTPLRLMHLINKADNDIASQKPEGKWSAKEQVGHLWDLESIWLTRVQDFESGKKTLAEADLENRKTHDANHNQYDINLLFQQFAKERFVLLEVLRKHEHDAEELTSIHPRLKTPMRMIDLAYFVAEHDDHHMAIIRKLLDK